jgi:hypothetical protein
LGSLQRKTIHLALQALQRSGHKRTHDKRISPRLARCERPTSLLPQAGQRAFEIKDCGKIRETILQTLITVQFNADGGKFAG